MLIFVLEIHCLISVLKSNSEANGKSVMKVSQVEVVKMNEDKGVWLVICKCGAYKNG